MAKTLSFILGCSLLTGSAAEFEKPQGARLIRHEDKGKHQRVVSASGVLKETRRHADNDKSNLSPRKDDQRTRAEDECKYVFEYGKDQSSSCCDGAEHIDERVMCINAAETLGLPTGKDNHPFEVNQADYPEGCFKKNNEDVMWYNSYGGQVNNDTSINALSKPLCRRLRYKLGTNDTNDGGCTGDWSRVMDEQHCRTFETCMAHTAVTEWRVGVNASAPNANDQRPPGSANYDDYPSGCFLGHHDQDVYFNVPQNKSDGSGIKQPTLGTGSKGGIPVCWMAQQGANAAGTCSGSSASPAPA
jgi:hypothetical protein